MASPFPGMDPYIEGELWTTFHSQMAPEIARQLSPKLAPRYVALTERRYVLDHPEDAEVAIEGRYPDVGIVETLAKRGLRRRGAATSAPLEMATVMAEKVPHFWVEIRDAKSRRLVTVIEFLSPTNKRQPGRDEYLQKRDTLLRSAVHLLEIDLVRKGRRLPMRGPLPSTPYFVFLSRAPRRPITEIWPVALAERLPTVPVPLLEGDADVLLDLQLAFAQVYDVCRYDLIVDYSAPPDVPLPADARPWLKRVLRNRK